MLPKLQSFLRERPFTKLQILLKNVPFHPLRVELIYLLSFEGRPAVPGSILRGIGNVRLATIEDVPGMIECRGVDADYARRLSNGQQCLVAVVDTKIVGFEWFCHKPNQVKPPYGYKLALPVDTAYAYDAFLLSEFRLKGFWLRFKSALADLMLQWSKCRVLTYVDYGNWISLRTHLRFGFTVTKRVLIVQILGRTLTKEMPPRLPAGFIVTHPSPGSDAPNHRSARSSRVLP